MTVDVDAGGDGNGLVQTFFLFLSVSVVVAEKVPLTTSLGIEFDLSDGFPAEIRSQLALFSAVIAIVFKLVRAHESHERDLGITGDETDDCGRRCVGTGFCLFAVFRGATFSATKEEGRLVGWLVVFFLINIVSLES